MTRKFEALFFAAYSKSIILYNHLQPSQPIMDNPSYGTNPGYTPPPSRGEDPGKTAAIVSYITIIGWLVSYFALYKDNKTPLASYHIRQSLMLFCIGLGLGLLNAMLVFVAPFLSIILSLASLVLFIFLILGIVYAAQGEMKPLPLIGEPAQRIFANL